MELNIEMKKNSAARNNFWKEMYTLKMKRTVTDSNKYFWRAMNKKMSFGWCSRVKAMYTLKMTMNCIWMSCLKVSNRMMNSLKSMTTCFGWGNWRLTMTDWNKNVRKQNGRKRTRSKKRCLAAELCGRNKRKI